MSRASLTAGRGADVVIEAAGVPAGFRLSVEAVRPGGQVVWLGKVGVQRGGRVPLGQSDAGEAHHPVVIRRGEAATGFSVTGAGLSGRAAEAGRDDLRAHSAGGDQRWFAALKRGETVRSVVMFGSGV